ncbi:MAG: PQQ-binding-like beta-propeller repeat protein [Anaerolineae bacterium]|nr:PQQ-binding-like beta-propeller repeat protein [Anaerolineae bacterium]
MTGRPTWLAMLACAAIVLWTTSAPDSGQALARTHHPVNPGAVHRMDGAFLGQAATRATTEGEWPMAGANPQRTSWTPEEVRGRLQPIWYRPIEPYISLNTQIIAANDLLYLSTARGLYALHTGTGARGEAGEVAWIYPTELPLGHSPTIHEGVAYVGGLDHKLHAVDALTGAGLWIFEAGAGFQTNPLVAGDLVYAGNRDGTMYAVYSHAHPDRGTLAWSYQAGGPILYSAAYQDNTIYFASNDSHAYALNATTGELVWRSAKLPGSGFHSWWPVVHQDLVVLAGGQNYRTRLEPNKNYDLQGMEREDLYPGWQDYTEDVLLGTRDTEPPYLVDAGPILQYHEEKPWRRTYLVLNRHTGEEVTYDFDGDGLPEYAPISWFGTHGTGNRYPPVVGTDGRLYQPMHYVHPGGLTISQGHVTGWQPGTRSFTTPSAIASPVDEPIAISAGGSVLYWNRRRDSGAGGIDYTIPNPNPGTGFGTLGGRQWSYWLTPWELQDSLIPGYMQMYQMLPSTSPGPVAVYRGASVSINGLYERHGDQNPPIPYKGRLYIHLSNAVVALGETSGAATALPVVPVVAADPVVVAPLSTADLRQKLSAEVAKILDAGHLRPGYLSHGIFDHRTERTVGENLIDYWHHPGDILVTLIRALPHLPDDQQVNVRTYIEHEFADYPPYLYVHIGWRDGAPREAFDLPPEVEADLVNHPPHSNYASFYEGWHYPPHLFYALWKYAQEFGNAQTIFDESKDRLEAPPDDNYLADYPDVHNAYIAGYLGYLELEQLAGYPESAAVSAELDRLLTLRASTFDKDNPWAACEEPDCNDYARALNVARNFMYLVPELAEYLRDTIGSDIQAAVEDYSYVAPYWFVTKTEHMYGEGMINPLYDSSALFDARAMILQEPREKLLIYLDVPAFERGDLFYLQRLILAIEAPVLFEKMADVPFGYQGDEITFALEFYSRGTALTMTDILPDGMGAPDDIQVLGTEVSPEYDPASHLLSWTDVPPDGQQVIIRYQATITTAERRLLVNRAELQEQGGEIRRASATVFANPLLSYLPVIEKVY